MEGATIEEFTISLDQLVDDRLGGEHGFLKQDVFVQIVAEYLIEDGALEDVTVCQYRAPDGRSRIEVAGYALSDGGRVLDLVAANYGNAGEVLPRDQALRMLRWAGNFARRCRDGLHLEIEESSPAYDMAQTINAGWTDLEKVRVFLLTDARTTIDALPQEDLDGLPLVQDLWDIERIRRLATSGRHEESITIDLEALGVPLRCLSAESPLGSYECLLTVIPGQLLADLYGRYGAKLLQRNVRAFLQARSKVNRGLSETISNAPAMFLAYNNGISATATDYVLEQGPEGPQVTKLVDLQIVNGGQTTASLHHARKRADLSKIQVPAKITIVSPTQLDDLVPKISRYANSQNTINEADFESNSPFHVELERLSRTIWAPAAAGGTRQSHWYYERVRGQYQVDRSRLGTSARMKNFEAENPRNRKFTKTDAAKYEMTFLQRPHVVSLGGQKCFQQWVVYVLAQRTEAPDERYFRELAAKALLFTQARQEIMRQARGAGYLAQVTTYTLARIVEEVDLASFLSATWREQQMPSVIEQAVQALSPRVRNVLLDPPGSGNVTEWSKKEDCWKRVLDLPSPNL